MHPPKRGLLNPVIRTTDEPMFAVVGILLQFISTPDQNGGSLSVMRGGIPPKAVIPLHSHNDPVIFYVLEGTMEVYQDDGISSGWKTAGAGEVVTIAGGVKHALRNLGSTMVIAVLVSEQQLYHFFRELAEPLDPNAVPAAPKPEVMQRLFEVAALSVLDRLTIRERSHWDKSGMTLRGSSKPMEVLALPHQPTNCAE
jgi:quercetin dioxygenase-like cupin family protein